MHPKQYDPGFSISLPYVTFFLGKPKINILLYEKRCKGSQRKWRSPWVRWMCFYYCERQSLFVGFIIKTLKPSAASLEKYFKFQRTSTNFKNKESINPTWHIFFLSSKETTLSNWLIKTNTIACPFCLDDRRPKCIDPVFLEGFLFWSSEAPCSATLRKTFLAVIRSDESEIDSLQGDWITRHTEKFSSFTCGLSFGLLSRKQYFFFIIEPFYLPNWINAYSTALRYLSSLILVVDVQLLRAIYSQYRFLYQP